MRGAPFRRGVDEPAVGVAHESAAAGLPSDPGDRARVEACRLERHVQRRVEGEHRRPAGCNVDALQRISERRHASQQRAGLRGGRSDDDGIEVLGMILFGQLQLPLTGVPA